MVPIQEIGGPQPGKSGGSELRKSGGTHHRKSRIRAKVEHVFGVIKNIFGFRKTRYRGLAKNLHRLEVTAALANLYIVRRQLLKA